MENKNTNADTTVEQSAEKVAEDLPPLPRRIGTIYPGNYWTKSEQATPPGTAIAAVYSEDQVRQAQRDAIAASRRTTGGDGWKWVPVEPTPEMIDAAQALDGGDDDIRAAWMAALGVMIEAAPVSAGQAEQRLDEAVMDLLTEHTKLNGDGIDNYAPRIAAMLNHVALRPVPADELEADSAGQAVQVAMPDIHTLRRLIECAEVLDKRPRPMCRNCADENGTCPNSGLECDMRKLFAAAKTLHNKLAALVSPPDSPPPAAQDGAMPEPIYQVQGAGNNWKDVSKEVFGAVAEKFRRIVFAAQPAEGSAQVATDGPQTTRLDVLSLIREHGHRCYMAGVNMDEVDPKHMREIEESLRGLAAPERSDTPAGLTAAARDVLAERRRQVEQEGWTPEHDDKYKPGALAAAAACYAFPPLAYDKNGSGKRAWPFADGWWKPRGARRDYVRAAALLLAEIERLDRARIDGDKQAEQGDKK